MTRLIDRLLSRSTGYNESMFSGSYYVTSESYEGSGPRGRKQERPNAGFAAQVRDAYQSNGPVFACILARMMLFSEARFQFQSTVDKHLFGNTDLRLLEKPWPNATTGELLARMEQDVSLSGNAYIHSTGDQLVRLRPDLVTIVSEEVTDDAGRIHRVPVGYAEDIKVTGEAREPQFYTVDEVCHWSPIPDPLAEFRGMSWLTPVVRELGADDALTEYKIAHMRNGAMPGLIFKYSQKLSDQSVENLRKRLQARFGGPSAGGRTLVLDEGADVTVAGNSLEQLNFATVQGAGVARIAAAAGVPLTVCGLGDPTTLVSGYETEMRRFADMTMRPLWRTVCASLQHLLPNVPDVGVRLWFDVSDIAALRQGEMERGQTSLVQAQAMSALIIAGFTRKSVIAAVDSGDMSQLVESPSAPPPGVVGRETATSRETVGGTPGPGAAAGQQARPPQAGSPQAQPGATADALPRLTAKLPATSPPVPNGRK